MPDIIEDTAQIATSQPELTGIMAKSAAQRVREAEASHRARGEREIRLWVPDTLEAIRQIRNLAAKLRKDARPRTSNPDDAGADCPKCGCPLPAKGKECTNCAADRGDYDDREIDQPY